MSLFNRQTTSTTRIDHTLPAGTTVEPATNDNKEDRPNAPLPNDIIQYLESQAYVVAHQFQSLMAGLHYRVQDMTQLTLENVQTHAFAVERFDTQVNALVEKASALIVQCDHLDQEMESIHAIANQLKGFHQMLDILEQQMRL